MKILALETATEACSVALQIDNEVIVDHRIAPRQHTELVLPMIKEILAQVGIQAKELDAVAFGRGPGAFTGVRIACGLAQGLALGAEVPLISVSTLKVLAQGAYRQYGSRKVITAIDARMGEVYYAGFEIDQKQCAQELIIERVCVPDHIELPIDETRQWYGAGTGFASYSQVLNERLGHILINVVNDALPHAMDILPIASSLWVQGKTIALEDALPVYLRDNIAKKSTKCLF